MSDCVFCMIANHEIPSTIVYEDDKIIAFEDLDPQGPVHLLVIPKKHICCLDDVKPEDHELMGHIMCKLGEIAKSRGLTNGYRVVSNNGDDAFQTVKHLHFHIIGGKPMGWPPFPPEEQ